MHIFDKRLEMIEAVVIAVKNYIKVDNDELDFTEYPDIPYVKELVRRIDVQKYSELVNYVDDMEDCSYYTKLYLHFDDNFNFDNTCETKAFSTKENKNFALLIKKIYYEQEIEEVFIKYKKFLKNFEKKYIELYKYDYNKIKDEFGILFSIPNNFVMHHNISFLINGGFSASKDNFVSYIKGIGNNIDVINNKNDYITVCLYHEIAHYFVNPIIDKFITDENLVKNIYDESISNGLPQTYSTHYKTVLYEYFVRAISIIFAKDKVSTLEIEENIKWFNKIGFVRVEEIIDFIETGIKNNKKFEEVLIDYFDKYENVSLIKR